MKTAKLTGEWTMLIALTLVMAGAGVAIAQPKAITTAWGTIEPATPQGDRLRLVVNDWPKDGRLELPTPFANITSAYINPPDLLGAASRVLDFEFNDDATKIVVYLPTDRPGGDARIVLNTAEKTTQYPDGRIVFSALDAKVNGDKAKLETHPGNHRIGFWANADDTVSWDYNASRWGMYDVDLTYSTAASDGTEIAIDYAGKTLSTALTSTGSWYRYTTKHVGKVYLEQAGKQTLTVRCTKKVGPAVMNLKAVTLRPTCEGTPPAQGDDGSVTLHARDVTIRGVTVRWEPIEKKQTVGYWANENDHVSWDFTVTKPGAFDIEILQGCGKGHGGSVASFELTGPGEIKDAKHEVVVEDTGHFQNFVPRTIGRTTLDKPGVYRLTVRPVKKAKVAVMDLRQVRLIPVK